MHLVYLPIFGIPVSPGYCSRPKRNRRRWLRKLLGINKVHYGLCENVEYTGFLLRCDESNFFFFFSQN